MIRQSNLRRMRRNIKIHKRVKRKKIERDLLENLNQRRCLVKDINLLNLS